MEGIFHGRSTEKNRKDDVAYGVNLANIYKRLGLQIASKGQYLKEIEIPFYILMQDRTFNYLKKRINFKEIENDSDDWDVTFITFDYTGAINGDGSLEFSHFKTIRTTIEDYVEAMSRDRSLVKLARDEFIEKVIKKSKAKEKKKREKKK